MALETAEYLLSCELRAHEDDGLYGEVLDLESGQEAPIVLLKTLAGHSSFVGPLAWIPPGDRLVGLCLEGWTPWDLSKGEVAERMQGHRVQVTGLAIDENGDIISSSID